MLHASYFVCFYQIMRCDLNTILKIGIVFVVFLIFAVIVWTYNCKRKRRQTVEHFAYATNVCHDIYVQEIEGFLTPEQCDALIAAAKSKGLEDSMVGEVNSVLDENVRKSSQTWFKYDANDVTKIITEKVLNFVKEMKAGCFGDMPITQADNFEDIQVVKYGTKGKYDPHFDSDECGDDVGVTCESKRRMATVLIYLNDDFKGGETRFPNIDNKKVTPVKGKAVFFWVSDPANKLVYQQTLHGGDPVDEGEKWIATQWIRRND